MALASRLCAVEYETAKEGRRITRTGSTDTLPGARLRYVGSDATMSSTVDFRTVHHLTVELADDVTGVTARLRLSSVADVAAISSTVQLTNGGSSPITVSSLSSLAVGAFPSPVHEVDLWSGASTWLAEGRFTRCALRSALPDVSAELHGFDARSRVSRTSRGSWSTGEHLPVGALVGNSGQAWVWQIEHNGPWRWDVVDLREGLGLALFGPTEPDAQWWQTLAPGETFTTVPGTLAVTGSGGLEGAVAELTAHRRAVRRPHREATKLPVVFNDYMNTLNGDPTTERLLPLIDAAAAVRRGGLLSSTPAGTTTAAHWWDSVGAWQPSATRFPGGIQEVIDRDPRRGMGPGLWLEPEVVGVEQSAGRRPAGRRVLPAPRAARRRARPLPPRPATSRGACSHLDEVVDRLVGDFGVGYFKLDYNINPGAGTDATSGSRRALDCSDTTAHTSRGSTACSTGIPTLIDRELRLGRDAHGLRAASSRPAAVDHRPAGPPRATRRSPPSAPLVDAAGAGGELGLPAAGDEPRGDRLHALHRAARPFYLSGHLNRMDDAQRGLVAEGVAAYKQTRAHLATSTPFWPLGLPGWEDGWVVLGLDSGNEAHLVIWRRPGADDSVHLPLPRYTGVPVAVSTAYPRSLDPWEMRWTAEQGLLEVCRTPAPPTARVLRLTPGSPGKDLSS